MVLQLSAHSLERLLNGSGDCLLGSAADHDLFARHLQLDMDPIQAAAAAAAPGSVDGHAAADDPGLEFVKLGNRAPDKLLFGRCQSEVVGGDL
jgi:hypothetical protein